MIWGTFGREGSFFLENAGRINLPTEQQRHLPQTLCHIISTWKLYKLGMWGWFKCSKCSNFCKHTTFFENFQGTTWAASYQVIRPGLPDSFFVEFNQDSRYAVEIVISVKLRELWAIYAPLPPSWNGSFYVGFIFSCFRGCLVCRKIGLETDIQSNCLMSNKMVVFNKMALWMVKKL